MGCVGGGGVPPPVTALSPATLTHTHIHTYTRAPKKTKKTTNKNKKQLYEQLRGGAKPPPELGASRDYNVDMVPKFMMANGKLVKTLIYTDVTKYLEFKAVDGSYVLSKGRVHKVPSSDYEALRSPLMGLFEKRRARLFFM